MCANTCVAIAAGLCEVQKLQGPKIDQRNAPSRWQKMPILAPEHAEVRGTYASHCEVNHVIIRETSSRVSDWSLTTV
jgi:hypothetical protein